MPDQVIWKDWMISALTLLWSKNIIMCFWEVKANISVFANCQKLLIFRWIALDILTRTRNPAVIGTQMHLAFWWKSCSTCSLFKILKDFPLSIYHPYYHSYTVNFFESEEYRKTFWSLPKKIVIVFLVNEKCWISFIMQGKGLFRHFII